MRHQWAVRAVIVVVVLAACGVALHARRQTAPKVIKGGVLDEITLQVPNLPPATETTVVIRRFSVEGADFGTGADGKNKGAAADAQKMAEDGPVMLTDQFVEKLTKAKSFKEVLVLGPDAAVPEGALVVEGRFLKIDPGSRAKRYFAGFGAGKSTVAVEGTVKDAKGETLATFAQKRHGSMGVMGGDSLGKLKSDSRSIGGDIAEFLSKWAEGKPLK